MRAPKHIGLMARRTLFDGRLSIGNSLRLSEELLMVYDKVRKKLSVEAWNPALDAERGELIPGIAT